MFNIGSNEYPLILNELSPIMFPQLLGIILLGNQIESIEGIAKIWMPALQYLDLRKNLCMGIFNNIHQITELKKTYWSHF